VKIVVSPICLTILSACTTGLALKQLPIADEDAKVRSSGRYVYLQKADLQIELSIEQIIYTSGIFGSEAAHFAIPTKRLSTASGGRTCGEDAPGREVRYRVSSVHLNQATSLDYDKAFLVEDKLIDTLRNDSASEALTTDVVQEEPQGNSPSLGRDSKLDVGAGPVQVYNYRGLTESIRVVADASPRDAKVRTTIGRLIDLEILRHTLIASNQNQLDAPSLGRRLEELDKEEGAILGLFSGTTQSSTIQFNVTVEPTQVFDDIEQHVLGYFSICSGWNSDISETHHDGDAVILKVAPNAKSRENLKAIQNIENRKHNVGKTGMPYRFPLLTEATVTVGRDIALQSQLLVPQKGVVVRLAQCRETLADCVELNRWKRMLGQSAPSSTRTAVMDP
jgi:hypothetical protein